MSLEKKAYFARNICTLSRECVDLHKIKDSPSYEEIWKHNLHISGFIMRPDESAFQLEILFRLIPVSIIHITKSARIIKDPHPPVLIYPLFWTKIVSLIFYKYILFHNKGSFKYDVTQIFVILDALLPFRDSLWYFPNPPPPEITWRKLKSYPAPSFCKKCISRKL